MSEDTTLDSWKEFDEEDPLVIVLHDADGRSYEATVLTTFKAGKLDRDYIAVVPLEKGPDDQVVIQLFRYVECRENGQEGIVLSEIPSDMEYEDVMDAFAKILENTD